MHVASLLLEQQRTLERAACALEGCPRESLAILLRFVRDSMVHLRLEDALSRLAASRTTHLWVALHDDAADHVRVALCDLAHTPTEDTAEFAAAASELRRSLAAQISYENEELLPCLLECCSEGEMTRLCADYDPRRGPETSSAA